MSEATKPEITPEHPVLALGGGPAGLTAGYLLAKRGKPVIVLESTDQVGGIARTDVHHDPNTWIPCVKRFDNVPPRLHEHRRGQRGLARRVPVHEHVSIVGFHRDRHASDLL